MKSSEKRFFLKKSSIVFRDTFSCELFQYFHSTHGRGGPAQRAREAIGSPQQRSHWFTSTREPLVHPKEPLVHPMKGAIGVRSGEKHQNLHEMVIHPTFRARSYLKIFSFQNPVRIRSSYCAKTFEMIV